MPALQRLKSEELDRLVRERDSLHRRISRAQQGTRLDAPNDDSLPALEQKQARRGTKSRIH